MANATTFMLCGMDVTRPFNGVLPVGPPEADLALTRNKNIRPCNDTRVMELAYLIESGEWQDDHPGSIMFTSEGFLVDGQKRLSAISLAGKTVKLRCVFGARPELERHLDNGESRQLAHRIVFTPDRKNNKSVSTVMTSYFNLSADMLRRPTVAEYQKLYHEKQAAVDFAAGLMSGHTKYISRAPVAVALCEMHTRCPDKAQQFLESILQADGDVQPARILRDHLIQQGQSKSVSVAKTMYRKCVYAMRAFLEDRKIQLVRAQGGEWKDE